jgi:hypothetical protein
MDEDFEVFHKSGLGEWTVEKIEDWDEAVRTATDHYAEGREAHIKHRYVKIWTAGEGSPPDDPRTK